MFIFINASINYIYLSAQTDLILKLVLLWGFFEPDHLQKSLPNKLII